MNDQVSAVEIGLKEGFSDEEVKAEIDSILGDDFTLRPNLSNTSFFTG